MIVLSRKPNEEIHVTTPDGTLIRFQLIEICGNKARLGIEAPREVTIHRAEVAQAIQREAEALGPAVL